MMLEEMNAKNKAIDYALFDLDGVVYTTTEVQLDMDWENFRWSVWLSKIDGGPLGGYRGCWRHKASYQPAIRMRICSIMSCG